MMAKWASQSHRFSEVYFHVVNTIPVAVKGSVHGRNPIALVRSISTSLFKELDVLWDEKVAIPSL